MIEFEQAVDGDVRPIVVATSAISRFESDASGGTLVHLVDGRQLLARVPYARFRDTIKALRSQFVPTVRADAG